MKIYIYMALIAALTASLVGCTYLIEENQKYSPNVDLIYSSLDGFDYSLNSVYALVRNEREPLQGDNLPIELTLSGTDNFFSNRAASGGVTLIHQDWRVYSVASSPHFERTYLWLYRVINSTNQIITRAQNPAVNWQSEGEAGKKRVIGEASTIRAWAYRHLTWLWGAVPIKLTESEGDNIITDFIREPRQKVLRQMVEDLKVGVAGLNSLPKFEGRVCRGVAQTYLAETYLALGEIDMAIDVAKECVGDPNYNLVKNRYGVDAKNPNGTPFSDMFIEGNSNRSQGCTESLWTFQWQYQVNGGNTSGVGGSYMRRVYAPFYDNGDVKPTNYDYYAGNGGGGALVARADRGGKSIGHYSCTPYAWSVYASSSDKTHPDDRFSDNVVRKYMVLSDGVKGTNTPADILSKEINTGTNAKWKYGDTIFFGCYNIFMCPGDKKNSVAYNLDKIDDIKRLDWLDINDGKSTVNSPGSAVASAASPGDNLNQIATWPYSLKYIYVDPDQTVSYKPQNNDQIYLRVADSYLLLAEAYCRKGGAANLQLAADLVNELRTRANAKSVTSDQITLDFILDERSRELLMEEHRRYTLLRFGGESYYLPRYRSVVADKFGTRNFAIRDTLYPIPQAVIDANLNVDMENNPGW